MLSTMLSTMLFDNDSLEVQSRGFRGSLELFIYFYDLDILNHTMQWFGIFYSKKLEFIQSQQTSATIYY